LRPGSWINVDRGPQEGRETHIQAPRVGRRQRHQPVVARGPSELEPPLEPDSPEPPLPGGRPNRPSNSLPPAPAAVSAKPFIMPISGSALRPQESWYDFAPAFISSPTKASASSSRRG